MVCFRWAEGLRLHQAFLHEKKHVCSLRQLKKINLESGLNSRIQSNWQISRDNFWACDSEFGESQLCRDRLQSLHDDTLQKRWSNHSQLSTLNISKPCNNVTNPYAQIPIGIGPATCRGGIHSQHRHSQVVSVIVALDCSQLLPLRSHSPSRRFGFRPACHSKEG